jgi:hypothetical protein
MGSITTSVSPQPIDVDPESALIRIMCDMSTVEGITTADGLYIASSPQRWHITQVTDGLRSLAVRQAVPDVPRWWAEVPASQVTEFLDWLNEPEIEGDPPILETHSRHMPMPDVIEMAITDLRAEEAGTDGPFCTWFRIECEPPLRGDQHEALRKKITEERATDPTLAARLEAFPGKAPADLPEGPQRDAALGAFFALVDHLEGMGLTRQEVVCWLP